MSYFKTISLPDLLKGLRATYFGPPPVKGDEVPRLEEAAYKRGHNDAGTRYNSQILEQRREAKHLQECLFEKFEAEFESIIKEINKRLPGIVMVSVRRVCAGIEPDRVLVENIIGEVMDEGTPDSENLEIFLSTEDFKLVDGKLNFSPERFPKLSIVEDPDLHVGDCMMRSRFGIVDGRMNTKLRRIESELEAG